MQLFECIVKLDLSISVSCEMRWPHICNEAKPCLLCGWPLWITSRAGWPPHAVADSELLDGGVSSSANDSLIIVENSSSDKGREGSTHREVFRD